MTATETERQGAEEAARQLLDAAGAKKCWSCGCLHEALAAVEGALPSGRRLPVLDRAVSTAKGRLLEVRYDCLGCEVCYPALAVNALSASHGEVLESAAGCPTDAQPVRAGWPPLAGSYVAIRYRAPVAVCTLTDEALTRDLAGATPDGLAIAGTLQTENLGIERLIQNTLANPHLRFLVLCGADSRQAVGHLPGQSLAALASGGLDERGRIVGARGKRPLLRNVAREAVEHFLQTVEVVDLVGTSDLGEIVEAVRACAARDPGPAAAFPHAPVIVPERGHVPDRMVPDPAGYFVVYVERTRGLLALEHYTKDGLLDHVVEGRHAAELYTPVVARGLLTRLDHAAYLGRELARAEHALQSGGPYVQDAAAERQMPRSACGPSCGSSCG